MTIKDKIEKYMQRKQWISTRELRGMFGEGADRRMRELRDEGHKFASHRSMKKDGSLGFTWFWRMTSVIALSLFFSGCIPALVATGVYGSHKKNEKKQEFLQHLEKINLEREKSGLKPLDTCTEMRNYNPEWAKKNPECL